MLEESLPHDGVLQVTTAASTYVFDFSVPSIIRAPDTGPGGAGVLVSTLRRDHQPIPLLAIERLEHGEPMILLLGLRADAVTIRETTPVSCIRWIRTPTTADLAYGDDAEHVAGAGLEERPDRTVGSPNPLPRKDVHD